MSSPMAMTIFATSSLVVQSDGSVSQIPPGIFQSTCSVDMTWFPFDEQTCQLKFGSWTNHEGMVNLTMQGDDPNQGEADNSTFNKNAEWELVRTGCESRDHRCYIVTLLQLLHCCNCYIVAIVTLLQLLHPGQFQGVPDCRGLQHGARELCRYHLQGKQNSLGKGTQFVSFLNLCIRSS